MALRLSTLRYSQGLLISPLRFNFEYFVVNRDYNFKMAPAEQGHLMAPRPHLLIQVY